MNGYFELTDIALSFGRLEVIKQLSFELAQGEFLGVIGPNGAGKTSVLNCISGVLRRVHSGVRSPLVGATRRAMGA
jgi:branched-chain amino acid transport system ATP-binding protein